MSAGKTLRDAIKAMAIMIIDSEITGLDLHEEVGVDPIEVFLSGAEDGVLSAEWKGITENHEQVDVRVLVRPAPDPEGSPGVVLVVSVFWPPGGGPVEFASKHTALLAEVAALAARLTRLVGDTVFPAPPVRASL